MPDPEKVLATVRRATELTRATPHRRGAIQWVPEADEVLVVGDLHGNVPTFRSVLKEADLDARPARHLVLQELVHGPFRYPDDRGDRSHQLVDLAAALKVKYPDRVHLILGNHELAELTGRSISKNGEAINELFRQGIATAYGRLAESIYIAYLDFFAAWPLAVRTENRVLVCHTIPDGRHLDAFDVSLIHDDRRPPESTERGGTIYAITWGRDTNPETADRFAALMDADLFVCGHQPCDEGFRQANHRQLIIDGTDPYPAMCLFPAREPLTIDRLVSGVRMVPMSL